MEPHNQLIRALWGDGDLVQARAAAIDALPARLWGLERGGRLAWIGAHKPAPEVPGDRLFVTRARAAPWADALLRCGYVWT